MSVMIPTFYGIPREIVERGMLKELSATAVKVLNALWYESQRCSTRRFTRTTRNLQDLVGGNRASHSKARAQLMRDGLATIDCVGIDGYVFELCDPETLKPWPGDPRVKLPYQRKEKASPLLRGMTSPTGTSSGSIRKTVLHSPEPITRVDLAPP